ncbi:hypothetical protein DPMN_071205 [Dreissena polymorpha]|uniref:Uncharacterized protein n=1 Tax=Dreissena polymorpha TaxID=45954 RepID=A0A9D4BDR3_DREPO|nr:hypothetical protein DPMN_192985 [Dreissena polymorpha]KAH3711536.1 hypothetical protein DPMN_071205 [Dreissena polymorpha]
MSLLLSMYSPCVAGRWPVELSIEVNAVPVLQFPSVTICNINPLKKDNMRSGPFQEKSAVFTLGKDDMIYDDYLNDLMNEMTGKTTCLMKISKRPQCRKNYMLFDVNTWTTIKASL